MCNRTLRGRACLAEGFNTTVSADGLHLPDKRADPGCWLRSGFESQRRQLCQLVLSFFLYPTLSSDAYIKGEGGEANDKLQFSFVKFLLNIFSYRFCNRNMDCLDGSDEEIGLCGEPKTLRKKKLKKQSWVPPDSIIDIYNW